VHEASFTSNGKYIAYTTKKGSEYRIHVQKIDEKNNSIIAEKMEYFFNFRGNYYDLRPYFVENKLFYIWKDNKDLSSIYSCNIELMECSFITKINGYIKCLFTYKGKNYFFHSIYDHETYGDSKYHKFRIHQYKENFTDSVILEGDEFFPITCPASNMKKIILAAGFAKGPAFISSDDYPYDYSVEVRIEGASYNMQRNKRNRRVDNFILDMDNQLSFTKKTKNYKNTYELCFEGLCKQEFHMTDPILVNGKIYYGRIITSENTETLELQILGE